MGPVPPRAGCRTSTHRRRHRRTGGGGNFYNTKPVQVSKRFARALVASALEGQTSYTEAFRLLGLKKAATFERLAEGLGVG